MPGSRGKNFRGGDLAEGLGLELLRPFAFIAPVPRTEDVGIDAVATLFRPDNDRLIAEDSFLVQVKAASVRSIHYGGEQLDWLRCLKLPAFWLSVNLANTTIELWSMIRAAGHPNFRDLKSATMCLDERPFSLSSDEMHVWLRKPILRWTASDACNQKFKEGAYRVLKEWIAFEMRCLTLRSLGMTFGVTWETNCEPKATGDYAFMHRPGQLQTVLEEIMPHIQTLAALSWPTMTGAPDNSTNKLLAGLFLVADYMREKGVDPDPNNIVGTLLHFKSQQQETQFQAEVDSKSESL